MKNFFGLEVVELINNTLTNLTKIWKRNWEMANSNENLLMVVTGILQRWQLIFYGTATNPIRIRSHQFNPVQTASQAYSSSVEYPFFFDQHRPVDEFRDTDFFARSGFQGYQGPYTGAASNVEASVTTLDGASNPLLTNRLPGDLSPSDDSFDSGKKIRQHDCDPQCDNQGCYGKGPTQCVACKSYRLDK